MTIYVDPAVARPRRPDDEPPSRNRPGKPRKTGGPDEPGRPGKTGRKSGKRKDPTWAKACAIAGAIVMVMAGAVVAIPRILADWATSNIPQTDLVPQGLQGNDISGAINFLLLGMDERDGSKDLIRADSIIIVHVPADHKTAFMVSLPRDAQVKIPAFPDTGYRGGEDKINAAFAFGSMTKNMQGDDSTTGRQRGAALTIETINDLVPGGMMFNGAAIISFDGFKNIIDAIGGVDLCVDVQTVSIHYDKNGVTTPRRFRTTRARSTRSVVTTSIPYRPWTTPGSGTTSTPATTCVSAISSNCSWRSSRSCSALEP